MQHPSPRSGPWQPAELPVVQRPFAKHDRPVALIERIRSRIVEVNQEIVADTRTLGPGYEIGHSYFCGAEQSDDHEGWFAGIITYEIEPLLREYWIDQPKRWEKAVAKLKAK